MRKAEKEAKNYTAWLCGGALVGPAVILTSAACVKDIQYMYVIAGYHKYISEKMEKDECFANTMKKIIHVCVPKSKITLIISGVPKLTQNLNLLPFVQ